MKNIKVICIILSTFIFSIFLLGCKLPFGKSIELNDNYNKIVETYYKTSYGTIIDFYELHLCVNNNNTINIYGKFYENGLKMDYIEGLTINITPEQKNNIVNIINKNNFSFIPKDVSTKSLDGGYSSLFFYDKQENVIKKCGGYNPYNKNFINIENSIYNCINEDDMNKAKENIKTQIEEELELNSIDY